MFRNYFKTAWRNVVRQTGTTVINISGLTLGISCSLVLFLLVQHMSSFDGFHKKKDRIFRVVSQSKGNSGTQYNYGVPAVFPDAFKNDFPEFEEVLFTSYRDNTLVTLPVDGGQPAKFQEESGIVYIQPNFFKMFDRVVLHGDAQKSLDDPNEAVISKAWAKRYFGKENAIGEVVKVEDREFTIGAIIEDAPSNTDFPFELMLSYITIKKQQEDNGWNSVWSNEQCYFLLKEGDEIKTYENRLAAFTKKYLGESDFDQTQYMFQPLSEIHYDDRFTGYAFNTTPWEMIYMFAVVAFVLIITACINFINLSTAEAIKRSKEVGVRKSLGSTRGQLIRQFLGETTMITLFAVMLSMAIAQLILSFMNPFLEMDLTIDFLSNTSVIGFLIAVTILVSLFSGLYPAFVVSSFKPAMVLKNQMSNKNSSGYFLRKGLVVTQFIISQFLIIVTIVIVLQMKYSNSKDLGFAREGVLFTQIPERESAADVSKSGSKMKTLRQQMLEVPGVQAASLSSAPPSSGNVSGTNFRIEGIDQDFSTQVKQVDGNYVDLYKLKLIAGRNLADLDTMNGFIVNARLLQVVGFKSADEILGKQLTMWSRTSPVIGVVEDFHTVSIREPIEATVMFNRIRGYETLSLQVDMARSQEVIAELKSKWEATYPEFLFDYQFMDDTIREFYEGVERTSVLLTVFTCIAIFIGCLGLFGLATFMANQKTKEIGVRKVLGASVESIVIMFSKEYVKLIVIGFVVAAPLAWWAMNAFLSEFAYKIDLGPMIFIAGLMVTLLIAMITVGYKSFGAAVRNPVNALRSE